MIGFRALGVLYLCRKKILWSAPALRQVSALKSPQMIIIKVLSQLDAKRTVVSSESKGGGYHRGLNRYQYSSGIHFEVQGI